MHFHGAFSHISSHLVHLYWELSWLLFGRRREFRPREHCLAHAFQQSRVLSQRRSQAPELDRLLGAQAEPGRPSSTNWRLQVLATLSGLPVFKFCVFKLQLTFCFGKLWQTDISQAPNSNAWNFVKEFITCVTFYNFKFSSSLGNTRMSWNLA